MTTASSSASTARTVGRKARSGNGYLDKQRGMGATIILFTIALIVLVGAALAYASRGNPSSMNTQSARVYAGVILKQSGDFRDAYSRFIFDGGNATTMTFNASGLPVGDLFNQAAQYGNYQPPPAQALVTGSTIKWDYKKDITLTGVGTAAGYESVAYVPDVIQAVCQEINRQLYGSTAIDVSGLATLTAFTGAAAGTAVAVTSGRASGCFSTADGKYTVYTTLGES